MLKAAEQVCLPSHGLQVRLMFPNFACQVRWATLAPPIARGVAEKSWGLANVLSGILFLRTHFVAVLVKP